MNMEKIVKKLTSRKLWAALAGFVGGIAVLLGANESEIESVAGIVMSGASVLTYIMAESKVDAAAASAQKKEEQ